MNLQRHPPLGLPATVIAAVDRAAADLHAKATFYTGLGLKVLPQAPGAKHPAIPWEPFQTRFPTPEELTAWFGEGRGAGICVVLDDSGFVVVDLDGPKAAQLLRAAAIEIPFTTPTVLSGSGCGIHLWFRTARPAGRHIRVLSGENSGVDVLGTGIVILSPWT